MKVLIQCDVKGWAIDFLTQSIMKYAPHHTYKCVYIPPRDAGQKEVQDKFEEDVREFKPDIVHFMYFRTASQLLEAKPFLKDYKIILSHQNQRDKALFHADWKALGVDCLTTATSKAAMDLMQKGQENVRVIKYGCELEEFEYNDKEPDKFCVGYAGRVVPWKGLKDVAEVCQELKVPLKFMGRMEKADYWETISEEARQWIDFEYMDCPDGERVNFYKSISAYIGFSSDGYEEGTLEYFEAMACGTPVITTPNGSAADMGKHGENCLLVDFGSREQLKEAILKLKEDDELRKKLKKEGWNTSKNYPIERYGHSYSKLYYEIGGGDFPLVSVIIPATYNRAKQVEEILGALSENSYTNIEIVLVWDELEAMERDEYKYKFPIKEIVTGKEGYNLAMARNMGVVESEGEILLFCDSRLQPDPDSILFFQQAIEHAGEITMGGNNKIWFFGDKGGGKRAFVENFSAVKRSFIVEFGMFNERIDKYGGMSQEIRTRWKKQGGQFTLLLEAKATEIATSKLGNDRRKDIIYSKLKLLKMYGNERV